MGRGRGRVRPVNELSACVPKKKKNNNKYYTGERIACRRIRRIAFIQKRLRWGSFKLQNQQQAACRRCYNSFRMPFGIESAQIDGSVGAAGGGY